MKKAVLLLTFFTFLAFFNFAKGQVYHPNLVDDYWEDISSCEGITSLTEVNDTETITDQFEPYCSPITTTVNSTLGYWGEHKAYLLKKIHDMDINFSCSINDLKFSLPHGYIYTNGCYYTSYFPLIKWRNVYFPNDIGYYFLNFKIIGGESGGLGLETNGYYINITEGIYTNPTFKIYRMIPEYFKNKIVNVSFLILSTSNIPFDVNFYKIFFTDIFGVLMKDKKNYTYSLDKLKVWENKSDVTLGSGCGWSFPIYYDGTYYYVESNTTPGCVNQITYNPTHNLSYWEFGLRVDNLNENQNDTFWIGVTLENGEMWAYKIYNNDPNGKIQLMHYDPGLDVWITEITYTTTHPTKIRNTKWGAMSIAYFPDNKLRLYIIEGVGSFINTRSITSDFSLSSKAVAFFFQHYNEAYNSSVWISDMGIYEFSVAPAVCGNGVCESGETVLNCPQDCPGYCGDGICNSYYENSTTCPEDCGNLTHCGNGICEPEYNETYWNCPQDCPLIQVSECFDITEPGYYYFSGVVKPESPEEVICIRIRASNVVLDMGDYGVDCTKSEGFGIMILGTDTSFNENVTVKNGFVKNCQVGFYIWHMRNVTLSNIDILMDEEVYRDIFPNKSTQIIGLYLWGVENSSFSNIYIERARDGVYLQYYYPPFTDIYTYIKSSVFNDVRVKWVGRYGFTLFDTVESSYFYDCKVDDSIIGFFCGPCYNSTILKSKFYGSTTGIRLTSNSKYNLIAYSEANKLTLDMGTKSNLVCSFVGEIVDKGNNTVRPICTEFLEVPGLNVTVAPPPYLTPLFVPSGLEILEFLFTPYFYLTLGAVGVSGLLTYLTGNPLVFAGSMLVFIIAYTLMGAYPLWFSIILGLVVLATAFLLYRIGVRR